MRRLFAIPLALFVFALAAPPVRGDEVLDASRKEKARQDAKKKSGKSTKAAKKEGEVLSNTGLKKTGQNAKFSQIGGATGDAAKDGKPGEGKDATGAKDKAAAGNPAADKDVADKAAEAGWRDRLAGSEGKVTSARKDLEELNQKINELRRMSSAADDPNVRLRTSDELRQAESQIPKAQQAIKDAEKGVTDLREEARRSGVPAGWLR